MKKNKNLEELQEAFYKFQKSGDKSEISLQLATLPKISQEKSLDIYRNNYLSSLIESLSDTYSACKILFGDELFQTICFKYCDEESSRHPNLSNYGESFPDFIKNLPISEEIPFISDLAHYEWTIKETILREFDQTEIPFESIVSKSNVVFELKNHVKLLQSTFPISEIWQSLISDTEKEIPEGDMFQYLIIKTDQGTKTILLSNNFYHFLQNVSHPHNSSEFLKYSKELKTLNIIKTKNKK